MLREDLTGVLFLVDTGAAASVYPRSKLLLSQLLLMQPHNSNGSFISTDSGAELPVQGTVHLQPEFAGLKHPHTFLVAEVNQPILGYPYLLQHRCTIKPDDAEVVFKCRCKPSLHKDRDSCASSTKFSSRPTGQDVANSSQLRVRQPGQVGTLPPSKPAQSFIAMGQDLSLIHISEPTRPY